MNQSIKLNEILNLQKARFITENLVPSIKSMPLEKYKE